MKSKRKIHKSSLEETNYHTHKIVKSERECHVDIVDIVDIDEETFTSNRFNYEAKVKEEEEDDNNSLRGLSDQIVFIDEIVKEEPVFYDANERQALSLLDLKNLTNKTHSKGIRSGVVKLKGIKRRRVTKTKNDSSDAEVGDVDEDVSPAAKKRSPQATKTNKLSKTFECYICKFQTKTSGSVKSHFLEHFRERSSRNEAKSKARTLLYGYRNYECYLCQFHGYHRQVAVHMRKEHTGQKIFQCKICGQQFLRKDNIHAHLRSGIHSTKRDYKCDKCDRSFARSDGLRNHLKTHFKKQKNVEKPHECSYCGKTFTRKSYMKRHALTHTGDRPFPCTNCKMAFTRNYLLTEHKQKMHGLN